jgi:DNA-binding winged helix-turn-helix (wHTH) protein
MTRLKFDGYQFDLARYQLTRANKIQSIRPKTAMLLALLLKNRERILSKKEIFESVWLTEYVNDHTLFQLISEIRKLSPSRELIRTQPNLGYQWVADTGVVNGFSAKNGIALAASLSCVIVTTLFVESSGVRQPKPISMPAISAYSKGVIALEQGRNSEAEQWFRFTLAENPDSTDTQLLLAQSLFQQDELAASEPYLRNLLQNINTSSYSKSAASDLMSRIYQRQGLVYDALQFSRTGIEILNSSQAMCTVEAIDRRILELESILGGHNSSQPSVNILSKKSFEFADVAENNSATEIVQVGQVASQLVANETKANNHRKLCEQLKVSVNFDTSSTCQNPDSDLNPSHKHLFIRPYKYS